MLLSILAWLAGYVADSEATYQNYLQDRRRFFRSELNDTVKLLVRREGGTRRAFYGLYLGYVRHYVIIGSAHVVSAALVTAVLFNAQPAESFAAGFFILGLMHLLGAWSNLWVMADRKATKFWRRYAR